MSDHMQGLPVPADQINTGAYCQNLPYNPPVLPNVHLPSFPPNMYQALVGYTMMALQQKAQSNPLRTFAFNLAALNNYQNADFANLVTLVADYTELLIAGSNGRMNPEQALQQASVEMVTCFTALNVQRFPALSQYVQQNNHAVMQEINRALAQFQQVEQAVAQMRQPQMQTFGGYGGGGGGGMGGGFQGNFGGGGMGGFGGPQVSGHRGAMMRPQMNAIGSGGWQQPIGHGQPMGGFGPAPVRHAGGSDMWSHATGHSQPGGHQTSSPNASRRTYGGAQRRRWEEENREEVLHMSPDSRQSPTREASQPSRQASTRFDPINKQQVTKGEWDEVWLDDGVELRPAHQSPWTVSKTVQPWPVLYNPRTHILFHRRDKNGVVLALPIPREDSMNYLDNELDPRLRAHHETQQPTKGKVVPQWSLVGKLKPLPKSPLATAIEQEVNETGEGKQLPPPAAFHAIAGQVLAQNLTEAELKIQMKIPDDRKVEVGAVVEFYPDLITLAAITDASPDADVTEVIKRLGHSDGLDQLLVRVVAQTESGLVTEAMARKIDERITPVINEALNIHLGLSDWTIDSFLSDYKDLIRELDVTYGESKVMSSKLREHAVELLRSALSVLEGEERKHYLEKLDLDPADPKSRRLVAFRDRTSVTYLPWSYADIEWAPEGVTAAVFETTNAELYKALASILERTVDKPIPFRYRYLETTDRVRITVHEGYLGKDTYLLTKVG